MDNLEIIDIDYGEESDFIGELPTEILEENSPETPLKQTNDQVC